MLPNEKSPKPLELALQANSEGQCDVDKSLTPTPTPTEFNLKTKKKNATSLTFADSTNTEPASQSSSTYKELLSQPPRTLTHRQRLLWLQQRRSVGMWVQCDDCHQWRYLPHVLDAFDLPQQWRCDMNPDKSFSSCSVPEAPMRVRDEEDLIHGPFSAGSVVWARLAGWPWWPAIVDDEPDTEQFYWLDGFSDIPTYYNVTFFDEGEVTRAWIATEQLKPYADNRGMVKKLAKDKKYKKRLGAAITQAEDALRLPLQTRLAKYSFVARFSGAINKPRKVSKAEIKKFQDRLKRKYNVNFSDESSSESDDSSADEEPPKRGKKEPRPIKKNLVESPKAKKGKKFRVGKTAPLGKEKNSRVGNTTEPMKVEVLQQTKKSVNCDVLMETEPAELIHENIENQIQNTITSTIPEGSFDNDTSATYLPPNENYETPSTSAAESVNTNDNLAETPKTRKDKDSFIAGRNLQDSSASSGGDEYIENIHQVVFKQPDSVAVQVGSDATKASTVRGSSDNDASTTYVPDSANYVSKSATLVPEIATYIPESEDVELNAGLRATVNEILTRRDSVASDDFDF